MSRRTGWIAAIFLFLFAGLAPASAADRWLHVSIVDGEKHAARVRVNLPLEMVEKIVPLIEAEGLRGGKLRLDSHDLEGIDLRAIWQSVRETEDAEFVTVESGDETVRVARVGKYLVANVEGAGDDDRSGRRGTVDVKIPIVVLDALFSSGGEELDLAAAIRALGDHPEGDLVRIEDGSSRVRVWIDRDQDGR